MVRLRVFNFISAFGGSSRKDNSSQHRTSTTATAVLNNSPSKFDNSSPDTPSPNAPSPLDGSPTSKAERRISRPGSMIFSHNPPLLELSEDTPAELQPIFGFLHSQANKLYHEGCFLKLNDLDTQGRPSPDRQWVECYAQLIGTVLSVWNSAALDAAEEGEEVPSTFINLTDASIRMIETLPTQNQGMQPLKNVLSICSAGQNRYLLLFNSFHSLTQWAAAIRLALYEHTSLYEAYTGSIIASKGRQLNGVRTILERNRFKHEDWARVRFGAGTPWRRCWFVITPPNEKEFQKTAKTIKKSAYDRVPKLATGDIKFYDTKNTKKAKPIATITDAFAAYAVYPQSKALIDHSTLVKIEGKITINSKPKSTSDGFVFVMPEVHPAVSGFETMLRFLMPTFDTFNLYGRPTRLIAATNHIKSIMFAFPNQRRYGYLDLLDVSNLIQSSGSQNWSEAEWRKQLKEATARRTAGSSSRTSSISGKPRFRASPPNRYSTVPLDPSQRDRVAPGFRPDFNQSADDILHESPGEDSASSSYHHSRGLSDITGFSPMRKQPQSSIAETSPSSSAQDLAQPGRERPESSDANDRSSDEGDWKQHSDPQAEAIAEHFRPRAPPGPVALPPAFLRAPGEMPAIRPQPSPDLRKVNNRMSDTTLTQLAAAGKLNLAGASISLDSHEVRELSKPSPSDPLPLGLNRLDAPTTSNNEIFAPHFQNAPSKNRSSAFAPPLVNPSERSMHVDTSQVVKRKPLRPQQIRELNAAAASSPTGEPSLDDLRHTVDEEALDRVGSYHPSVSSPDKDIHQYEDSVYDDASTTSPDYASTHESVHSKQSVKSVSKPRMGVMKTVGLEPKKDFVIGDAHYSLDQPPQINTDIPTVDFGPTLTYLPTTRRPSTGDTLRRSVHQRSDSEATEKRVFAGHTQPMDGSHTRSSSRDEFRRNLMWQPGMASARPATPGGGLTPEQFVQQRAAPSPPVHHYRRTSSTTPPPQRPLSGDWMNHSRSQSRMSNRDAQPRPHSRETPRPHSRGASSVMNYNDISSHLSAREQEHVARMTGSSFFNFSEKTKPAPPVNPMGLVGAIDARERERLSMKEGLSNQMVQHAIVQRQQHWQQQQQQQQFAPIPPPHNYGLQSGRSVYNLPAASQTWDALNQSYRADEPRRQSWYGQFASQPQTPPGYQQNQAFSQMPPGYQQSQAFSQQPGYFANANTPHY